MRTVPERNKTQPLSHAGSPEGDEEFSKQDEHETVWMKKKDVARCSGILRSHEAQFGADDAFDFNPENSAFTRLGRRL
jgi:hypothetical protein